MSLRIPLGRARDMGGVVTAFLVGKTIEIDEVDGVELTRRRIFLEDVTVVTSHQERGPWYLFAMGSMCFLGFLGARVTGGGTPALVVLFITAPFAFAFGWRLIMQKDVVTVFGRFGKARMEFEFRKARGRAVYSQICNAVRAAQMVRPKGRGATTVTSIPEITPESMPQPADS